MIEVMGQRDLVKNFSKFSGNLVAGLITAIEKTQAKVVNHARANHGYNAHQQGRFQQRPGQHTGNLIKSIIPGIIEIDDKGVVGHVDARADYAGYVEGDPRYKNSNVGVYPFLGPAAEANRKYFYDRVREALKRALP